jgi:hypothetical protein
MDIEKNQMRMRGLQSSGVGLGPDVSFCDHGNEPSGSTIIRGISLLIEQLLDAREGLYFVE